MFPRAVPESLPPTRESQVPSLQAPKRVSFVEALSSRPARRGFALAFIVAVVVHAPFSPLSNAWGLFRTFLAIKSDKTDWEYKATEAPVSIELFEPPKPLVEAPRDPRATEAMLNAPPASPMAETAQNQGKASAKATAPESGAKAASEVAKFGKAAAHEASKDKTAEAAPAPAASARPAIGLVSEESGAAQKPNVTFALWFSEVREHPLAAKFESIMRCSPEWKAFAAHEIDPMRDVKGLLAVGSQIGDPSKTTIAVEHGLSREKAHAAVDSLVKQKGAAGAWLDEKTARVTLGRRSRVIAAKPSSRDANEDVLFIVPPTGAKSIAAMKGKVALPEARGRVASLTLVEPARPFRKVGVELSTSLRELRLDVIANLDRSVDLRLEFESTSEREAERDREKTQEAMRSFFANLSHVAAAVDALSKGESTGLSLPEITFSRIEAFGASGAGAAFAGVMNVPAAQVERVLELLKNASCPKSK